MRMASKRPGSTHDLFAAVDRAGSEIDVDTSAVEEFETKATGARNENSVLFSLDALKSGVTASKGASPTASSGKKAPPPPTKRLEDLMTLDARAPMGPIGGVGGGLLLSGNDALLTAPAPPPPKPEPKPVPVPAAAAGFQPVIAKPRNKVALIAAIVVGIGVVGTGGAFIALKFAAPETPAAASASASALAAPAASAPAIPSTPTTASTAVAAGSAVPEAPAASASASASKTPAPGDRKVVVGGGTKEPTKPEKKPETKPEPSPAAAGGFSKDAAVAALSVAASQATVCKKPEGPWGTGKCLVTFAPSGRVTSANVTGAPFAGTPVGGCVSSVFRRAKIPAFNGDPVTVSKSFTIAP